MATVTVAKIPSRVVQQLGIFYMDDKAKVVLTAVPRAAGLTLKGLRVCFKATSA